MTQLGRRGSARALDLVPVLAGGVAAVLGAPALGQCRIEITQQPSDAVVCPSGSAPFSVSATGDGPLGYRWEVRVGGAWLGIGHDPLPLACGGFAYAIPPLDARTRIGIHPCDGVTSYQIRCVVSNSCTRLASEEATYTICRADFNCDGSVDFFDYLDFARAFDEGTLNADFNADGTVDFFDYLDFAEVFAGGC